MTKLDKAVIEECMKTTRELLEENWDQIASMKDDNEGRIKVSAAFLISFKGNEQAVKTTLTYGRRVTESRESIINPDQLEIPFNGQEPPEMADDIIQPKKRVRRGGQVAAQAD
jgi:hypothetical protein